MSNPRVCMAVDTTVRMIVKNLVDAGFKVVDGAVAIGHIAVADFDGTIIYKALRKGGKGEAWIVACYESPYLEWGIVDNGRKEEIERDQEHPGHPDQTGEDRDHLVGG